MLDATQVRRQRVAARLARRSLGLGAGGRRSRLGLMKQALELLTQGGFVLHQRFLEQAALVCVHGLGLGAVGPALEPGQLEVDLLDPGLAQRDLAVLALQQCVALGQRLVTLGQLLRLILHLLLQLGNQRGDLGWQVLRVDGSRTTHAKHAFIVPEHANTNIGTSTVNAWVGGVGAASSGPCDDAQLRQPLPRQSQHQGVELRWCE